jgi:phosphomannomutase
MTKTGRTEPITARRQSPWARVLGRYDIRGRFPDDIDLTMATNIGESLGVLYHGPFVVGRDVRAESKLVQVGIERGLRLAGASYLSLGVVPTPAVVFAARSRRSWGVSVTPSHNPSGYVGVKCSTPSGRLFDREWGKLKSRLIARPREGVSQAGPFSSRPRSGTAGLRVEVLKRYVDSVTHGAPARLKVVLDCRGGATAELAPRAFRKLGASAIEVSPGFSATFHGGSPEPSPTNVGELRKRVVEERADVGASFDGDGDRVLFVDERGLAVPPEAIALFLYQNYATRSTPIVTTYDASVKLETLAPVYRTRTGSRFVVAAMDRRHADVGFETSDHFYLTREVSGSDGLLTACRLVQALSRNGALLSSVRTRLGPISRYSRSVHFESRSVAARAFSAVKAALLRNGGRQLGDGVQIGRPWGTCFVRRSNTQPLIRFAIETTAPGLRARSRAELAQYIRVASPS